MLRVPGVSMELSAYMFKSVHLRIAFSDSSIAKMLLHLYIPTALTAELLGLCLPGFVYTL